MRFIGYYNKSVWLTYLGILCSLIGIVFCINKQLNYAFIMLIIGGLCDIFDGMIARRIKRNETEKNFGVQIDTLADITNFIILPFTIFISMDFYNITYLPIVIIYVFTGIIRLAYFNVTTEENSKYYIGLPVTFAALFLPFAYLLIPSTLFSFVYLILAFLYILNFKFKKPGIKIYMLLLIIAVVIIIILLRG